jgi:hypothetical protein
MDRFVVGSGRCGSTLLTKMLAKHPDLLVLSEFFTALDRPEWFSDDESSGAQFAELISRVHVTVPIILRREIAQKEVLLNPSSVEGAPLLMMITLPQVSSRPDRLYQELIRVVSEFPVQSYLEHYNALFGWLMRRTGKQYWLERSGPSDEYLPELIRLYPDAKYVHLHRDGREAALSMRNHPYFQLIVSFFFDPPSYDDLLATEYGGQPVSSTDTLSRRLAADYLPPERYAEYWSYQETMAFKALARLDRDQCLDVRFEDVVDQPEGTLLRIAEFLGLPRREDWIAEAAGLAGGMPPPRFGLLSPHAQAAVAAGCRTGQLLLGRETSEWATPTLHMIRAMCSNAGSTV